MGPPDRNPRSILALALALGLIACRWAQADLFILKDGTRHEGTAAEDGDLLVITTYDGKTFRLKKDEVIGSKREPQRNEFHARAQKLKPDDAAAHYDLGVWAKEHGLAEQALEQFHLVLKTDPRHEGAGKALGYSLKEGRWVSQEEEPVAIRPAHSNPRSGAPDRGSARKVAAQLAGLSVPDASEWEKSAEVRDWVVQAKENPELFAMILKAPGQPGGAETADGTIRAKAAALLGLAGDRRAMQPLLDACFQDPDDRVRLTSAKFLPRLDEPIALRKLVDVAVSGKHNWPTRKLACIAIRRYGDKTGVARLLMELSFELAGGNFLDSKNKPRAAVSGPGSDNPLGMSTDQPPLGTQDETIVYPALSALKEVTGASVEGYEKDFKTWREWWKKAEPSFKFKD